MSDVIEGNEQTPSAAEHSTRTQYITASVREQLKAMRAERRSPYVLASPKVVRTRIQQHIWSFIKSESARTGTQQPVVEWLGVLCLKTGIDYPLLHEMLLSKKPATSYPNSFVLTILAAHFKTTVEALMEHPKYGLQHKP